MLDGARLVEEERPRGRGRDRAGQGGRRLDARHRGVDGTAGRVEDGARLHGRLRRQEDQQPLRLARVLRAFLLGLFDFRRPLSLRNLDLLALLSFSVSLWFFNHGNIFTSVPLAYPRWRISSHAASGSACAANP